MNDRFKQDLYEEPEMEIVTFGNVDVLSASGPDGIENPNQLPIG